ncbi:Spc98 family-domain-containing protein [Lactarius indigo]|nr:Spc98 family-domain-containing protein [Lactarius indigo]
MISEVLLVLAGHASSLFPTDHTERKQCLESIALIASRYRKIKNASSKLSRSSSRYVCALASTLNQILKKEYEALVVETEDKVLSRDSTLVANGSFVPLSSIRCHLCRMGRALCCFGSADWKPGPLIDLLTLRSSTGVHRVANIMSRLSLAVQRVWKAQLTSLLIHGSIPETDPIVSKDYVFLDGCVPSCVSAQSRSSISYVGKAIGKVKAARWRTQFPRDLAADHARQLDAVHVEDQYAFDRVITEVRTNVSEWFWMNGMCRANYFLIRNGEFNLSLIREIERLKISRLTSRTGPPVSDSRTRPQPCAASNLASSIGGDAVVETIFNDIVLGTPVNLLYTVDWPLDMFLQPTDMQVYGVLFAFLSSLRKTHTRVHTCWTALSNAQRARRRWTGCSWGLVREMNWFLENLLSYVMTDVIDSEFKRLKKQLNLEGDPKVQNTDGTGGPTVDPPDTKAQGSAETEPVVAAGTVNLDFTTLQNIHSTYLERLSTWLSSNEPLAQVERWGGDVLPALLSEGSMASGAGGAGKMVKERWSLVSEINETFHSLLDTFYEQLAQSTSQQAYTGRADASKSGFLNSTIHNVSMYAPGTRTKEGKRSDKIGEMRRHIERLLLRLDFNEEFSRPRGGKAGEDILRALKSDEI